MSSNAGLKNAPLRQGLEFNWVFLVELILCGVLVVAAALSYGLRTWTWHKYRVFVDVQSFQVSLLAGRVFFKGFRYHGNNETVFIQSGYITWRYWIRNVRTLAIDRDHLPRVSSNPEQHRRKGGGRSGNDLEGIPCALSNLPCRLIISLNGLEWFIYNRSLAYDAIADNLTHLNPVATKPERSARTRDSNFKQQSTNENKENDPSSSDFDRSKSPVSETPLEHHTFTPELAESLSKKQKKCEGTQNEALETDHNAVVLQFLPLQIDCEKAAVIIGNHNTKSVLITKIDKAQGKIDALNPSSNFDLYRQQINVNFEHPIIQIKPNNDYKEDQTVTGSRVASGQCETVGSKQPHIHTHSFFHRQRRKAWHLLQDIVPAFRSSVESLSSNHDRPKEMPEGEAGSFGWQGLSRYLDENEQDENYRWASTEYASVSTIFESLSAEMEFYWDAVGIVRGQPEHSEQDKSNNINGAPPPEWGINLSVGSATINYGPWADRQRADIQNVFFPNLCKDTVPTTQLASGQPRVPTEFKLNIEFDAESVLRIPVKEASKNWKWIKSTNIMGMDPTNQKTNSKYNRKAKSDTGNQGPEARPFGWLDIKFEANSALKYCTDMVAGYDGYSSKLDMEFPSVEIMTSVNHGLLWKSFHNRICCDLSTPLRWNGSRTWKFDIISKSLELFILREHIFLITDLVEDWASGPSADYLTFCPFQYHVNLHLDDFKIYFNVNDSNIISNPSDFDDNTFIVLFGSVLTSNILMPLNYYRPYYHEIPFDVSVKNGGFYLLVPPWNTQATFLASKELATLKKFSLEGKYQYCSNTSPGNIDTLLLDVYGQSMSANLHGFAVRYLFKIKDNYFGDDIQFRTLEEYQEDLNSRQESSNPQKPHKFSNDLDVIMSIFAENCSFVLPSNLYSAGNHIRIEIPNIASDLRFTNYYMEYDLELNSVALSSGCENDKPTNSITDTSSTQLFLDGVNISGSRLFGLPPTEPTYVCNWEFSIGPVTGECTTEFLRLLASGARVFGFSFNDDENVLPSVAEQSSHDVTFLRASLQSFNVWLHVEDSTVFLSTAQISVNFNDLAGLRYSKKINVLIPGLRMGLVDTESALDQKSRAHHLVETNALIQSTLSLVIIERNPAFEKDRLLQQEHLKRHDQRTNRSGFLLNFELVDQSMNVPMDLPTMRAPPMPAPVFKEKFSSDYAKFLAPKSFRSCGTGRKGSFLSLTSSHTNSKISRKYFSNTCKADTGYSGFSSGNNNHGCRHCTSNEDASISKSQNSSIYSVERKSATVLSAAAFSKQYMKPNFPFENVRPDISNLPESFTETKKSESLSEEKLSPNDDLPSKSESIRMHTSFIISFPEAIRGFIKPKAAYTIAKLLTALQAINPADLLDDLQIDCMNEILRSKNKSLSGAVLNLGLRVPSLNLRILNPSNSVTSQCTKIETHDQLDLLVSGLAVTVKSETEMTVAEIAGNLNESSTIHISISSATISTGEKRNEVKEPQAALKGVIENLELAGNFKDELSAHLKFRSLELATSCSHVEYLASLIHRTKTLAVSLSNLSSFFSKLQDNRIKLFTFLVATTGQRTAEPLFLTRPSYILRSAAGHLRTEDSWTIIARLHHMYNSLDVSSQREIASRCSKNTEKINEDAQQCILSAFSRWWSWDLNSIDNCIVISRIFDKRTKSNWPPFSECLFKVSLRTEFIWLVVDPGPKQNAISMSQVSLGASNTTKPSGTIVSLQVDNPVIHLIVFDIFLADFFIEINWDLCGMARDILRLYHQHENPPDLRTIILPEENHENILPGVINDIHVVVSTQKASINIDTININSNLLIKEIEASFMMTRDTGVEDQTIYSFVTAADTVISKIKSHSQDLSFFHLRSPCVYASYIERSNPEESSLNTLKVAANCQQMKLIFKQDVLALIEVLDLIVLDEISQGYEIMQIDYHDTFCKSQIKTCSSDTKSSPKISVALFLDSYQISIPLLQFLTYTMFGNVARASIAVQLEDEMIFNFDIKDHLHDIDNTADQKKLRISRLKMPPTNGRITMDMSQRDIIISVIASMELITLDATVAHTLLATINRPEVSSTMADLQKTITRIKIQIQNIFFPEKSIKQSTKLAEKRQFLYNVHLTLAGFRVFADSLGSDESQNTTRLDLNIGCIQLVTMNFLEPSGPVLEFPELSISSKQIKFELARWNLKVLEPCGSFSLAAYLTATSKGEESGQESRSYHMKIIGLKIDLFADTASLALEVLGNLQNKIKDLGFSREKIYLRKLRESQSRIIVDENRDIFEDGSAIIFKSIFSLELVDVQISWLLGTQGQLMSEAKSEDLVLSLRHMVLSSIKQNSARLKIEDLQVQMVPTSQDKSLRSLNSALLPEVIFNVEHVSTGNARRLAFQAGGKSLDMCLTSHFMIPASALRKSIVSAIDRFREASAFWTAPTSVPYTEPQPRKPFLGKKRLESLLVDADFAGAVVHLSGKSKIHPSDQSWGGFASSQAGKYSKFINSDSGGNNSDIVLRSPGLAWKVEYKDNGIDDLSFNAEVKVDASSNILYPSVVPLILEMSSTVKKIVGDEDVKEKSGQQNFVSTDDTNILPADPTAVLGRTRLNLGLRICRQEFGLSCQPISRVAATAQFDDIYIAVNTMRTNEHGHFLAASATIHKLKASVQHVYSREATGSFDVDHLVLSLMNSKHVSSASGISAILKISPMKVLLNARQLEDFLLFREIWVPTEIRQRPQGPTPPSSSPQSQTILVQRYQQVAATGAFSWDATVSITELDVQLNLGQAIGKSSFKITNFWLSSKKNSALEQNLCIGIDKAGVDCTGRMSGFITLESFKLRTSIEWPAHEMAVSQTPLIQASLGLSKLCVKAAFDYHAFLVADITSLNFLMYNVRSNFCANGDRLVAILEGEAVHVFSTTTTASQALALYQAFHKLIQEKKENFETSISEIEKLLKRRSTSQITSPSKNVPDAPPDNKIVDSPISLHTDVIVILKAVKIGIFPNTFSDNQVLKLEALDSEARFAVKMDNGKIHSTLGLTLGQLRIGLAGVKGLDAPRSADDISVEDVISSAVGSRGGTILKVPKVEATMKTWQVPKSNHIEYIFKSSLEGKVEVGWNYSRISYIRTMWATHSKALTLRLGKPLPPLAVRITNVPDGNDAEKKEGEHQRITAEVNVPQSKYDYTALEPPVIETPQLRDMGEATPPLEWIGLHRDRLPNLTHQIVIVTLLELASEVEDAYAKILGSS